MNRCQPSPLPLRPRRATLWLAALCAAAALTGAPAAAQGTVQGSMVGSPAEMAEMMKIVSAGKVEPVPLVKRSLDEADAALQDLRKGLIMGRAILIP